MSRRTATIAVATMLVLIAIGIALRPGDERRELVPPERSSGPEPGRGPGIPDPNRPPSSRTAGPPPSGNSSQAPDPVELAPILDQLAELATDQSPSAIPKIAAYFEDPTPEIRSAARESMIQLGERAAIPYLLKAAESAATTEEAREFREAADFIELPADPLTPSDPR